MGRSKLGIEADKGVALNQKIHVEESEPIEAPAPVLLCRPNNVEKVDCAKGILENGDCGATGGCLQVGEEDYRFEAGEQCIQTDIEFGTTATEEAQADVGS